MTWIIWLGFWIEVSGFWFVFALVLSVIWCKSIKDN